MAGCPLAQDDTYLFAIGERRDLLVLANDQDQGASPLDPDTLTIIDQPDHAVLDRFEVVNGRVHYRAQRDYVGPDSFTYEICNTAGKCDTATVSINISPLVPIPDVCSGHTDATVMFSYDTDRRNAEPLDGAGFIGANTYISIYAEVPETTERVAFYVDDPNRTGRPFHVELACPYDLIGTGRDGLPNSSLAIGDFGIGFHSITIEVFDLDGSSVVRTASFGALVFGDPGPPPAPVAGEDCGRARGGDVDLQNADLTNCLLTARDLRGANLAGADLSLANLRDSNLTGADLTGAVLINANLQGTVLVEADFDDADLSGANLNSADAEMANFAGARFMDATLVGTSLLNVDFENAQLQRAALMNSKLNNAELTGANLEQTDFTNATGTPSDHDGAAFFGTVCPDGSTATGFACWLA